MSRSDRPYADLGKERLILRDRLAADRTILANERTLLAYLRTALTMTAAGVSFIQFFSSVAVHLLGFALLIAAATTVGVGIARHRQTKRRLQHVSGYAAAPPTDGD